MKKVAVCTILIMTILMASSAFAAFTDVSQSHWAYDYVDKIQGSNIINGYPDGTFKPDNMVKACELIKMTTLITWKNFKYPETLEEGEHWAMPYVRALERVSYKEGDYDSTEKLENPINRGEAVKIISKGFIRRRILAGIGGKYDSDQKYIDQMWDIRNSDDEELKKAVNICVQFGIINGFEDGTFRPDDTLTRAQVAKIMYVIINK